MFLLPQKQSIGELLGQGLSDIAGHWAQHRTNSKSLRDLGFSDAEAKAYSHLGPKVQEQAIHARQQQQAQEREAAVTQSFINPNRGAQSYGQPSMSPQPTSNDIQKTQMPHEQQQAAIQQATSIAQNPNFRKLNEQQQGAQALQQKQLASQFGPQSNQPTAEQRAILQAQAQQGQREPSAKERLEEVGRRRKALVSAPISPNQKKIVNDLLRDEEAAIREEIKEGSKRSERKEERIEKRETTLRKELESISKRAERAHQDIHLLKQIKAANDTGTLIQGPKRRLLEDLSKKYGYNFQDYFTNPTTENAAKLIERMQTGAGTAFGTGRLTNFIAEAYGKSLPRLANSQEGMDVIIKNLILEDKGHIAFNDEIRKIKAEYRSANEILPADIEDMARERVQPKLDTYAEEALKNIDIAVSRQEALSSGKIKKFSETPNANKFPDGAIGTNKKTGQKLIVKDGKWVPYK